MFLSHFPKIHKMTENLTSEQVEHAHKSNLHSANTNYENRNKCITIYIFITDRCKHTVVCIKFKKKKINKFSTQLEKCIPMGISEHNCQSSDHPSKEHPSKTV
jgi:hypothetical protein